MTILEKIYYTWLILVIPTSLCGWIFLDEEKHPMLMNIMGAFIWLPIAIALVAMLIWAIVQVWI